MKNWAASRRVVLIVCLTLAECGTQVRAGNVVEDMWGVAIDPLKLGKASKELSDGAQRVMIQLTQLEGVANSHVEQRLEQLRTIVQGAIDGTDAELQKAKTAMSDLEKQVDADANQLIYNNKCAVDETLMSTSQKAFAGLVTTLKKTNPSLNILGVKIVDLSTNDVQITDPDKAYISTKDAVMTKLRSDVSDKSKAYDILSAYQNLAKSATYNRCYYKDQIDNTIWAEEANEQERLSIPWVTIVEPDINFKTP
jgi:hypothetical protein